MCTHPFHTLSEERRDPPTTGVPVFAFPHPLQMKTALRSENLDQRTADALPRDPVGQERASGNTRPVVRKKDGLPIGFLTERQKGEYGDGSKMEPRNQNFIASQHPMQLVGPRLSPYQWGFPRPTEHVSSGDRTWPRPTFHLGWLYYSTQLPTCEDRLCDWHYKRI